ncbi:hypothetical protein HMPREF3191_01370 [Veillonellaceae bacterium DNF00626]|nr:hypothetical protein HMPREF3191_01370 [Veillonellaceae bacterium DNF00626]
MITLFYIFSVSTIKQLINYFLYNTFLFCFCQMYLSKNHFIVRKIIYPC